MGLNINDHTINRRSAIRAPQKKNTQILEPMALQFFFGFHNHALHQPVPGLANPGSWYGLILNIGLDLSDIGEEVHLGSSNELGLVDDLEDDENEGEQDLRTVVGDEAKA